MSGTAAPQRVTPAALGQLLLAVLLLGAGWPMTKAAQMQGGASAWFGFGRAALSMVSMTVVVVALGQARRPRRADLPALFGLGVLQIGSFFVMTHLALAWVPAGRTAILSNAVLVWTVPIALLFTRERLPPRRWMAAGLGLAGVVAMVGPWAVDWGAGHVLLGNAFLLGAALSWALAIFVLRRFPPRSPFLSLLPWAFAIAAAEMLPVVLTHDPGRWNGAALGWLGLVGLLTAPLGTWFVVQASVNLPLVVASVGLLAGPVVGLLLSVVWLGEPLTPGLAAGTALILGGAALAAGGRRG